MVFKKIKNNNKVINKKLFVYFVCILLFANTLSQAQQNTVPNIKGNIYALVVGIANYQDKEIPQLQYSNKDAEVFADFLKSKAGGSVPAENIQLLVDSFATTGAVYDALYWLRNICTKDDLVYFYFSGHGDIENANIHKNGFLICYDSPPTNYVKLSVSIDYLNDIANTLSAQTQANVVLITDACRSGKLAGSNKGLSLVGEQLRNIKNKEIRITSSSENQLSNENEAWGEGRGVFSWYLVNGLKGDADKNKNDIVTLDEIKNYLITSLNNDALLKKENIIQTPVLNGRGDFQLAIVDSVIKSETEKIMMVQSGISTSEETTVTEILPADAQDYFFLRLKKERLEELTDSLQLNTLNENTIPFAIIKRLKEHSKTPEQISKLTELENILQNQAALKRFKGKLAVAFDKAGQQVINQYLKGDEADLEKRRYYNANNNGYDVYPKMFAVALKLTPRDNEWYNILTVKLHYFTGVSIRLKIPTVENAAPLIEQALAEQKKAFALASDAAYINNELGILYSLKKEDKIAENYFLEANRLSPKWVVPWANLSAIYATTNRFEKGIEATEIAKTLSPGLQCIYVHSGYIYEKKGNTLLAEELYRKAIYINSRHYGPFERLGYVNMNTARYALADSFFYEAELRKKGFHFEPGEFKPDKQNITPTVGGPDLCNVDSNDVSPTDVLGNFAIGINATETFGNNINADGILEGDRTNGRITSTENEIGERAFKKVIALDKSNPLAFHYLGKLMYWQQRWAEADILFNLALKYHLNDTAFQQYVDSMSAKLPNSSSKKCIIATFNTFKYDLIEDHYFLADIYKKWHHYSEAEAAYRKIISMDPSFYGGYYKLWQMLEGIGRYDDAELLIRSFMANNPNQIIFGENELHAFYERVLKVFPTSAEWNYKAGNFLYQLAANHPDEYPLDKKQVTPDTYEEVFIAEDFETYPHYASLPGPWKDAGHISAPLDIHYPRNEGIICLLKADSLSQFSDEKVAGINDKIGDLYTWQGLPGKAIQHYQKALTYQPSNSGVRMKLIDVNDETFHFQDAMAQLDSLKNRNEINFSKMLLLAKYQLFSGMFAEGIQVLNNAEKIHPYQMPEIVDLKALHKMLSQQPLVAMSLYKKLLSIYPEDYSTMFSIAKLNARLGKNAEAWKWLAAALDNGFKYAFVLQLDEDMKPLRKSANWNKLLKKHKMETYINVKTRTVDGY